MLANCTPCGCGVNASGCMCRAAAGGVLGDGGRVLLLDIAVVGGIAQLDDWV